MTCLAKRSHSAELQCGWMALQNQKKKKLSVTNITLHQGEIHPYSSKMCMKELTSPSLSRERIVKFSVETVIVSEIKWSTTDCIVTNKHCTLCYIMCLTSSAVYLSNIYRFIMVSVRRSLTGYYWHCIQKEPFRGLFYRTPVMISV